MRNLNLLVVVLCAALVYTDALDAYCPVSGEKVPVDDTSSFVQFQNGQRIYTCCEECAKALAMNVTKFLRSARDDPIWDFVPDLTANDFHDVCESRGKIETHTPRVQLKYGQSLYFGGYPCTLAFQRDPAKYVESISMAGVLYPANSAFEDATEQRSN